MELLALFGVLLLLAIPIALLVMLIVAFARSGRIAQLEERIAALERRPAAPRDVSPFATPIAAEIVAEPVPSASGSPDQAGAPPVRGAMGADEPLDVVTLIDEDRSAPSGWEMFLGRGALGWIAVAAFVLAAATFLKYAFDNELIGPQGQLAIVLFGGCLVLWAGYHYALAGWKFFSELLFAAGIVVIYLATWAAFGYYYVVSQDVGVLFLLAIIVEAALLALVYDAWMVALAAVVGGLATPLLMHSVYDNYPGLFTYLALVNAGVIVILLRRHWSALGTIALVGTQAIFWGWYWGYFHPEKLPWALAFQLVIWALYLGHHLAAHVFGAHRASLEDLARLLLGALLATAQLYYLLAGEFEPWLGLVTVAMAAAYVVVAQISFRFADDNRPLATALAAAAGLIAWAIALEVDARWVGVGWAVLGALLWWFGLRVRDGWLRLLGAVPLAAAVLRLITMDTPYHWRDDFIPILNLYAFPALVVVGCVLLSAMLAWRESRRLSSGENVLVVMAGLGGAVLLGAVVSWDLYSWFALRHSTYGDPHWVWAGQVAVSIWWGVYASALLAIGFVAERPAGRWLALALFAFTVLKVFFVDLAQVDDLFRILALFALALLLGGAAWAYQRAQMRSDAT